jgi:hypothetical protein
LLEKEKAVQALQTKLALTEATNEEHTKRLDALRACYEKRLSEKEEEHQKAFRAFKRSIERAYAISKARLASALLDPAAALSAAPRDRLDAAGDMCRRMPHLTRPLHLR